MYAKISSNGDAISCCTINAVKLGNVIDGTFALWTSQLPAPMKNVLAGSACW